MHKFLIHRTGDHVGVATSDIGAGGDVTEYGVRIGRATEDFRRGDYVHTHNLKSARW